MVKFIQGDLERLYMNGIEGEYFQEPHRARALLNVLFVWAEQHPGTAGYRQGMHEIAAPVLLALEAENSLWTFALSTKTAASTTHGPDSAVLPYFSTEKYIESSLYWLFERIMQDLEYLYKPPTQTGELPGVVLFCTQVQEEMLRSLDPDLCSHLEDNYVQAQLYGMRWSRLLLGREFQATEESLFRIWDYIFGSSLDIHASASNGKTIPHNVENSTHVESVGSLPQEEKDPLFNSPSLPHCSGDSDSLMNNEYMTSSAAMKVLRKSRLEKPSPILESLADFMLAMLLHIREDLLHGDNSTTLQLLMRYPAVDDITPIMDLADMIRRGVLDSNSHVGASTKGVIDNNIEEANGEGSSNKGNTPTWLWREGHTTRDHDNDSSFSLKKNLQGVTRKMSEKINHAVSASVSALKHEELLKKPQQVAGNTSGAPKRKTSIGTKNNLFGIAAKGRSNSISRSLFGEPLRSDIDPQADGEVDGESLVTVDARDIEVDKCSVVVHNDINRVASYLEAWVADKSREEPSLFIPDVINRLRQLGGLLDQSLSLKEYNDAHIDNSLQYHQSSMDAMDSTKLLDNVEKRDSRVFEATSPCENKVSIKSEENSEDEVLGDDFFASSFRLSNDHTKKEAAKVEDSDDDDIFLTSPAKATRNKTSDEDKINAIFSDLIGGEKKPPERSPFDF